MLNKTETGGFGIRSQATILKKNHLDKFFLVFLHAECPEMAAFRLWQWKHFRSTGKGKCSFVFCCPGLCKELIYLVSCIYGTSAGTEGVCRTMEA